MADQNDAGSNEGYYAYEGLDRVLHEKARLGILTALVARLEGLSFVDLKRLCSLTDGNLSRHLQVLQDGGLVEIDKQRDSGRPQTTVKLTTDGRTQFVSYLDELQRVIRDAREHPERAPQRGEDRPPDFAPA